MQYLSQDNNRYSIPPPSIRQLLYIWVQPFARGQGRATPSTAEGQRIMTPHCMPERLYLASKQGLFLHHWYMIFPFQNYRVHPDFAIQYVEQIIDEVGHCIASLYIEEPIKSATSRLLPKFHPIFRSYQKTQRQIEQEEDFWEEQHCSYDQYTYSHHFNS